MKRRKWFQHLDEKTGVMTFTQDQWNYLCVMFKIKSKSRAVQKRSMKRQFSKLIRAMLKNLA